MPKQLYAYNLSLLLPTLGGGAALGAFASFTKHDPIKNIDIRRDEKPPVDLKRDFPWMQNRIPVGTKTFTFETGKLARDGTLDRVNIKSYDGPISFKGRFNL